MTKLTLDDINDLRAYERERVEFRQSIIALKKRRRVGLGPVITLLFENRDTIRFQIQEMARAEKTITDEGIQVELDVYNPLIPEAGSLAATLFIELTSDDQLRDWLPKLVGIETMIELRVGPDAHSVRCTVDEDHEKQLTRDDITASVHYVHFELTPDEVALAAAGPVVLASVHPNYRHQTVLGSDTCDELLLDLTAPTSPIEQKTGPAMFAAPCTCGNTPENPTLQEMPVSTSNARELLIRELFGGEAIPRRLDGRLLRTREVAVLFQVSERAVTDWASKGRVPSVRTPGGHRRYPAELIRQLLVDTHRVAADRN